MPQLDSFIGSWTDDNLRARINELPNYTSLVIYGSGFTDEGAELLTRCADLKELQLVGTSISDAGLRFISELKNLDWLVIDRAAVTDSGLSTLSNLQQLNGLQLISTGAGDDGFQTLRYLPKLTYLEATDHYLRHKELALISELPHLSSLRLASTLTDDTDFLNLSSCRSLQLLSFDMPLVSEQAIEQVKERLSQCQLQPSKFFRNEDKISYLSSYCFDLYEMEQYDLAWMAANDVLNWFPFNPAVHGALAFINFQMGNFEEFRKDLEKARENASRFADGEVFRMADRLLSIRSPESIKIELQDKLLRDTLLCRMRDTIQGPKKEQEISYTKMLHDRFKLAVLNSNNVYRNQKEKRQYEEQRQILDRLNTDFQRQRRKKRDAAHEAKE
mgnify:CR=1 FL=1